MVTRRRCCIFKIGIYRVIRNHLIAYVSLDEKWWFYKWLINDIKTNMLLKTFCSFKYHYTQKIFNKCQRISYSSWFHAKKDHVTERILDYTILWSFLINCDENTNYKYKCSHEFKILHRSIDRALGNDISTPINIAEYTV